MEYLGCWPWYWIQNFKLEIKVKTSETTSLTPTQDFKDFSVTKIPKGAESTY